jgi:hypothetical protein
MEQQVHRAHQQFVLEFLTLADEFFEESQKHVVGVLFDGLFFDILSVNDHLTLGVSLLDRKKLVF